MQIQISRNDLGQAIAVLLNLGSAEEPNWAALPYDSATRSFTPKTESEQALLEQAQAVPGWATLDLSDLPPATLSATPDWRKFRLWIMAWAHYDRVVRSCSDPLAIQRLENAAAIGSTDWVVVKSLWNRMVQLAAEKFDAADAIELNRMAQVCGIPLRFNDVGLMI